MTQLGIMIEGQEGLNWDRWRRICGDVERLGFASLRRSDHLVSLMGTNTGERDCIECWESLALAAEWTKTIEFGPMVTPITFRLPGVLAKLAASVDSLSGGRLLLGVGAGWNQNEHRVFDIPFFTEKERFDRLEAGIKTMRELWRKTNPTPVRNPIPLLLGGKGLKRTMPLVAREAAEWNYSRLDVDEFRNRRDVLDQLCRDIGRDPRSIKRSVMTSYIIGRDRSDQLERAAKVREVLPSLQPMTPEEVLENRKAAWLVGTPEQIAERIRELSKLGIDLFMLQHLLLDDADALELLGEEVLPAIA
ncbi:MAG TPA: LLM class flavin-dependent oxidoreductase [Candidatus Dormibacteraeota bacterium]|jgi:alkanesulfonate monooxygenase SsuD/methylene tetrahydromethanopterin reductase-like flavin-dependent oxidoreductase (luciferase family)